MLRYHRLRSVGCQLTHSVTRSLDPSINQLPVQSVSVPTPWSGWRIEGRTDVFDTIPTRLVLIYLPTLLTSKHTYIHLYVHAYIRTCIHTYTSACMVIWAALGKYIVGSLGAFHRQRISGRWSGSANRGFDRRLVRPHARPLVV